jgi:hypothetical protein
LGWLEMLPAGRAAPKTEQWNPKKLVLSVVRF